jgi:hypothetical protein
VRWEAFHMILKRIRQIVRRTEETTGHSVRPKWNWGLLFVRPEWIGVRPNCSFVRRFLHARKSKCTLVQDYRGSYIIMENQSISITIYIYMYIYMFLIMSPLEHGAAKWKTGLSCRSHTAIIGKQVNLGFGNKYEWHKLFNIFTIFSSELIYCADINLRHSDLFPSQTELKVIGHHQTYVRPKLKVIRHFVRQPCKRYFKAWLKSFYC